MRGLNSGRVKLLAGGLLACGALASPVAIGAAGSISFSIVSSPDANPNNNNFLNAATCVASGGCWAVGRYGNDRGVQQTLVEHDTGSGWSLVPSPNTDPAQDNMLNGVTCVTASDCWAVGDYLDAGYKTLTLHWDGTSWSRVASPNQTGATMNTVTGVSCVSSSDCSTSGYWNSNGGNDSALVMHWDGSAWSIVTSPNPASSSVFLNAVSCSSDGDCVIAGDYYNGTDFLTLIEERVGGVWQIVSSPNGTTSNDNVLNGISCTGGGACWAVGDYYNGSVYRTLTLHRTSAGWARVTSPNTGSDQNDILNAVDCVSDTDCVAVGMLTAPPGFTGRTFALQHTGTGWSVASTQNSGSDFNNLSGVGCLDAQTCAAVGEHIGTNRLESTLVEESSPVTGADLSVKLLAATTAVVGHNVTYHLHIANAGPLDATGVRVHFSLPVGTTFVSATGGGRLDANADSVRWSLSSLAVGTKIDLTVTLRMDQVKSMRASASIRASTPDPNTANNSSSILTRVSAG